MAQNYLSIAMRDRARDLRRNHTEAERRLWERLRGAQLRQMKFRRQQPIGPFIADFCCVQSKLIVEIDGGHHAARTAADTARSAYLTQLGYRVLRFWNRDVLNDTDAVLDCIAAALSSPHPDPLPEGEGEESERNN